MEQENFKHTGVLGMRWGVRKGQNTTSKSIKTTKRLEKGWKKLKNKKLSSYYKKKEAARIQRTRKLVVLALVIAPTALKIASAGTTLGKRRISEFTANREFNKYGGFDPKGVVNSRMWNAPPTISGLLERG